MVLHLVITGYNKGSVDNLMTQKVIVDTVYSVVGDVQSITDVVPSDKICMMMTRLACNRAIESSYWRMDNNSDVGLLTGYVLYRLPIELEFMDLDTFSR
jgi:hypothetical protein